MDTTSPAANAFWKMAARDPLLHFVVLGALIFAVDHFALARREDAHVIVVSPEVVKELGRTFQETQGRAATPAELAGLRTRWVEEEVLYREALALRLDQGDSTLRERLIRKVLSVLESSVRVAPPDEAELRAWFAEHRAEYGVPARFDFTLAPLASNAEEADAWRLAATLNDRVPDELASRLQLFAGRPSNTVVDAFGAEFVKALEAAPLGTWQVLPSSAGPRIVRLEYRTPATESSFVAARREVARDVREARAQALRSAAVRELSKKYTIKQANGSS